MNRTDRWPDEWKTELIDVSDARRAEAEFDDVVTEVDVVPLSLEGTLEPDETWAQPPRAQRDVDTAPLPYAPYPQYAPSIAPPQTLPPRSAPAVSTPRGAQQADAGVVARPARRGRAAEVSRAAWTPSPAPTPAPAPVAEAPPRRGAGLLVVVVVGGAMGAAVGVWAMSLLGSLL
ncbi:MAG: hypothetical protein R3F59_26585 [Myxococcota bacterium]